MAAVECLEEDHQVATKKRNIFLKNNPFLTTEMLNGSLTQTSRTFLTKDPESNTPDERVIAVEKLNFYSGKFQSFNGLTESEYISNMDERVKTPYHDFSLSVPMKKKGLEESRANVRVSNYSIIPFFNFHAPQYEEAINGAAETSLPNVYVSAKNGLNDGMQEKRHFQNKAISRKTFTQLKSRRRSKMLPVDSSVMEKTKNIIFGPKASLSQEQVKNKFPFGVRLSFDYFQDNHGFKNTLSKLGLFESIMRMYLNTPKETLTLNSNVVSFNEPLTTEEIGVSSIDLSEALEAQPVVCYFDDSDKLLIAQEKRKSTFGSHLRTGLLKTYIKSLCKDKLLSLNDAYNKKKTYSEIVFYKIDKFIGLEPGGTPVQSILIPANRSAISYIDTQVRYDTSYSYSVSAVAVAIGSIFSIADASIDRPSSTMTFINETETDFRLVEVPLFSDFITVISTPPPPPMIDFYTQNNSSNSINIRMYTPRVDRYDMFQVVEEVDSLQVRKLAGKNKMFDKDLFSYSGGSVLYDIYRLQMPPKTYDDFKGKKYLENVPPDLINSKVLKDRIRPNQKYYYMIRGSNSHGLKSNPSTIYEVELIKDADSSKVIFESYSLPVVDLSQQTVNMKQLLQLIPAPQHVIYDPDGQLSIKYPSTFKGSLDDIKYGIADKPIWGRKFKIRVTSNDTGRKIDINVLFNLIKKKGNEDFI